MDRLGQDLKFVSLGAGFFQEIGRSRLAGEQQNLAVRKQFANTNRSLDAVHVLHDDVADDQVWSNLSSLFDRCRAGVDRVRLKTILVEDKREAVSDHLLIVNNKDTGLARLA